MSCQAGNRTRHGGLSNNATFSLRRATTVAQSGNLIKRNLELKATRERTGTGGAHLNTSNEDGRTSLHWASRNGHAAMVKLLIEMGADMDICDIGGWTPLQQVLLDGEEAVVRVLIEMGADIHTCDLSGWTPLQRASMNGREAVVRLLIEMGADVDVNHGDV